VIAEFEYSVTVARIELHHLAAQCRWATTATRQRLCLRCRVGL